MTLRTLFHLTRATARMARQPHSRRTNRSLASACVLVSSVLAGCSSTIEGDLDLSPLARNLAHPGAQLRDTDILGPIIPDVETPSLHFYGVRPFFTAENRDWAEGKAGERETVVSYIAPFGKYHSNPRTTQLRFVPLFWSTHTQTAPGHDDYDFQLSIFVWYGSTHIDDSIRGIGERDDHYFALFPLAGRIDSFIGYDHIDFLGWPILQRLTKRVFREEPEEEFNSIALLFGWTTGVPRGGSWHIIPLYAQSLWTYPPHQAPYYAPDVDPNEPLPSYDKRMYLWPFIHIYHMDMDRGPNRDTHLVAVWPFYKREWSYDHEYETYLWPFYRVHREYPWMRQSYKDKIAKDRSDITFDNLMLDAPIEGKETANGEDARKRATAEADKKADEAYAKEQAVTEDGAHDSEHTNILRDIGTQLIYRYIRTQDYWRQRILLLLWAEYHTLPETKTDDRIDSLAILQPILFWKRDAWWAETANSPDPSVKTWTDEKERWPVKRYHDKSYYVLVPFFMNFDRYYLDAKGNETGKVDYFTKLWPLFSFEQNADGSADSHIFSLLPLRVERFVKDFNDAWLPFVNLYGYKRKSDAEGGGTQHTALFTLVKWYHDATENTVSIPVLYTGRTLRDDTSSHYTHRFLFGLFGIEGEDALDGTPKSKTMRLFWIPIPLGSSSSG